ncbi:MAG TPA: BrnT family toxin [Thermoanaerobaculia bacterium]|nr:BrnT family toxin [Thermoanaerobaculia bacterium]
MKFEWDAGKATKNLRKHRVSFDESVTTLADWLSTTITDPDHSEGEARFILVGESNRGRILVVWHSIRGKTIRIIGARRADSGERKRYEESV